MTFIKDKNKYRQSLMFHRMGHSVLANLFLRAAYGVK